MPAGKTLKKIGKYQIISKVGKGGMGAVYIAKHPTLNRKVIIKQLIMKKNSSIVERFKREARIMMDFRSERIVQVYDHFKEGRTHFIAMEYVDGISLDKLIEKKRYLSNEAAIIIFTEVCRGLKYAHDRGVIHRDIKPDNILISRNGEVKLVDFGIAKSNNKSESDLTKVGSTLGSPAYMAPEQISDTKNVDKKADIYSMGVMFYKMVTGRLPFPCDITPQTIARIEKGTYVRPKEINPRIFSIIQKVIRRTMQPNKNKRYKDLSKVLNAFKGYFRKFGSKANINQTIKKYIHGSEVILKRTYVKTVKKELYNKPLVKLAFLIFIFGLGVYTFYKSGIFYDLFMNKSYGALKVIVKLSKRLDITPSEDVEALLFVKDSNKYKELKNRISFKKQDEYKNNIIFESPKKYLKTGYYRLDVIIKNKKLQKFFYVNPRFVQRTISNTKSYRMIRFDHYDPPSLPLSVRFDLRDAKKNTYLKNVTIYIWHRGKWLEWGIFNKYYRDYLKSNKDYFFYFEKKGYYSEKHGVSVDPYKTIVNINVELTPIPGKLYISSNDKNLKILLNGSKYYYKGGRDRALVRLQPSIFQIAFNNILYFFSGRQKGKFAKIERELFNNKTMFLAPGEYELTVKRSSAVITNKIKINPNNNVRVYIDYNKRTKKLKTNIK